MVGLRAIRKRLMVGADVVARNRAVRQLAQRVPYLRVFDGGFHLGPDSSAARGPWRALVLGAPRDQYAAINQAFPEFRKQFVANRVPVDVLRRELDGQPAPAILVWGASGGTQLSRLQQENICPYPVFHISRGPVDLGRGPERMRGYTLDWTGLHSNPRRQSDLETILNHFPFGHHSDLVDAARQGAAALFQQSDGSGPVVVVCQDRSDPAAVFAGALHPEVEDLIAMARADHPRAEIVLLQVCPRKTSRTAHRAALEKLGQVVDPADVAGVLDVCRALYTGSADIGFEAVMRHIPVTTVGAPFYAGWGLTDDRRPIARRDRDLNIDELCAAVLLLYSRFLRSGRLVQPLAPESAE